MQSYPRIKPEARIVGKSGLQGLASDIALERGWALMTSPLARPLQSIVRTSAGRFILDFWTSPRTAWRRFRVRRTWPARDELEQMGDEQFEMHMRAVGMTDDAREGAKASADPADLLASIPIGPEEPVSGDAVGIGIRRAGDRRRPKSKASST
jgi:hypothetical protein